MTKKKLFAMDLNWTESLKGLGMDPSSIGRAECPLSQRELPTPPPIASRSSSPANKGHFQLPSFSFLSDDYRAAALFTTSNYVGNTKLWAPEKLVGGEEVAIEYGEAEDVCKVFCLFFSSTVFSSVFVYFHLAADLSTGTACWHSSEGCYLASKIFSWWRQTMNLFVSKEGPPKNCGIKEPATTAVFCSWDPIEASQ